MGAKTVVRSAVLGLHERFHARRTELFFKLMQPSSGLRVLDLGAGTGSLVRRIAERIPLRMIVADIDPKILDVARRLGCEGKVLTGGNTLPFDTDEFDIVLCNSVIEHISGPREDLTNHFGRREWMSRAWGYQTQFALEVRRISRGYFVQTPHRYFPIESHTWLPAMGWVPRSVVQRLVPVLNKRWIKPVGNVDWSLLTSQQMGKLFPDGSIHIERLVGVPKSVVSYKPCSVEHRGL